ncbi:uncharacterized protein LOC129570157 [Sitodiplosis mosellana]|uniref:uncharacterized protein LOC129570157 n=1 Tax=Sitodiplosis mosellana TaxID=263140 RepID=UPI0024444640|nr:uncharacterized protein LOC129570157 [Sitodiplosis mosellana]
MTITIRKALKGDMPVVYELMKGLAEYMQVGSPPAIHLDDLYRDGGFDGGHAYFFVLLAEDSDHKNPDGSLAPVGYTMYSYIYCLGGKSMFMRNMFVKPSHRLKGVGKLIFGELVKYAKETGCHRMEFLVPEWNPAKEFYKKMGAVNYTLRTGYEYYRLNEDAIHHFGQE